MRVLIHTISTPYFLRGYSLQSCKSENLVIAELQLLETKRAGLKINFAVFFALYRP